MGIEEIRKGDILKLQNIKDSGYVMTVYIDSICGYSCVYLGNGSKIDLNDWAILDNNILVFGYSFSEFNKRKDYPSLNSFLYKKDNDVFYSVELHITNANKYGLIAKI